MLALLQSLCWAATRTKSSALRNLHSAGRRQWRDIKRWRKIKQAQGQGLYKSQRHRAATPSTPFLAAPLPSTLNPIPNPPMRQAPLLTSKLVVWATHQSLDPESVMFPIWCLSDKLLAWPWIKQRQSCNLTPTHTQGRNPSSFLARPWVSHSTSLESQVSSSTIWKWD